MICGRRQMAVMTTLKDSLDELASLKSRSLQKIHVQKHLHTKHGTVCQSPTSNQSVLALVSSTQMKSQGSQYCKPPTWAAHKKQCFFSLLKN